MQVLKNIGLFVFAVAFTLFMCAIVLAWVVEDTWMRIKFKWNAKPEGLLK